MYVGCTLHARCMYVGCTLHAFNVRCMSTVDVLENVRCMSTVDVLKNVRCMSRADKSTLPALDITQSNAFAPPMLTQSLQ